MGTEVLLLLVLLGGLLAAEGTTLGQFMASRPIVATPVAGLVLGDPATGLMVGAILELFLLPAVPVGGVRYPETGPAAVVAAAAAVLGGGAGGLALAVFFGLTWGVLGGWTQERVHEANAGLVPTTEGLELGAVLARVHRRGVAMAFVRGCMLAGLGIAVVAVAAPRTSSDWPLSWQSTWALLLIAAALPLGSLLGTLGGVRRRGGAFVAGALLGALIGVVV